MAHSTWTLTSHGLSSLIFAITIYDGLVQKGPLLKLYGWHDNKIVSATKNGTTEILVLKVVCMISVVET